MIEPAAWMLAASVASLVAQIGTVAYWGGRIAGRIEAMEARIEAIDRRTFRSLAA